MSLLPEIELAFGDGDYICALRMPQLFELEEKCGYVDAAGNRRKRGVFAIYGDLVAGIDVVDGQPVVYPHLSNASAFDIREVIRLGLIGGAKGLVNGAEVEVNAIAARQLVERYVDPFPLERSWSTAVAIVKAAVTGYEPPKKDGPAEGPARQQTRKPRSKSATS